MWTATALVVGANVFNIGADLGSMADAFRLLVPIPFAMLVIGMTGDPRARGLRVLRALLDRPAMARALDPRLRRRALRRRRRLVRGRRRVHPDVHASAASVEALVAIFGTTISPYLFVWQAGEEVEEIKAKNITRVDDRQIRAMRVDVFSG